MLTEAVISYCFERLEDRLGDQARRFFVLYPSGVEVVKLDPASAAFMFAADVDEKEFPIFAVNDNKELEMHDENTDWTSLVAGQH